MTLSRRWARESYGDVIPPWGPIGYVVYKRTYARRVEDEGRTEEWWETCLRCINGLLDIGAPWDDHDAMRAYDMMFRMKWLPSGRAMWQLGTRLVSEGWSDPLVNCWFVPMRTTKALCFLFEQLMLGGGVGFSVSSGHIQEFPKKVSNPPRVFRRDATDSDFIVPDSREGWVALLRRVLKSWFDTGRSFSYSLHCVRSKGAPIRGFGGEASGPDVLQTMVERICRVLEDAPSRLRDVDVLDLANIIGACVVAGNVRRSAQIALGDPTSAFLRAKRWDLGSIPPWRAMSNNSVLVDSTSELGEDFWDGYLGNGEPYGLVNLRLMREHGRLGDGRRDPDVYGVNPCGEVPLAPFEPCNLSEVILPNCIDLDEVMQAAMFCLDATKTIASRSFMWPETNDVVRRNMRVGVSVTGVMQPSPVFGDVSRLGLVYDRLRKYDAWLSGEMGVPESIRITTVQPSGTKSLLAGVTHGAHPAKSRWYVRRVRMSADNPLVEACRRAGCHVEPVLNFDGTHDASTMVISFPVEAPRDAVVERDVTAVDQLRMVEELQRHWSDNAVSVTVGYSLNELPDVTAWLDERYADGLKSVSFLLRSDHGFAQAPYEPIDKEAYERMAASVRPVFSVEGDTTTEDDGQLDGCEGGSCPVR